ncbi:hypothetical protein [Actinocorallia populi]|uniref:hypothetical protein n=1 Tax=Actinocorallia populi TaxID=2079200 RepID=UPI001E5DDEE2|nr:hypothetical protein [Actinocorallia populi]
MDSATVRHDDEGDEEYQEAYWRRRAIALGAVVLVVGGLAWSCSAGGGEQAPAAAKKTAAASPSPTVSGGGSGSGTLAIPTVMVTVTQTATVAAPRRPGDACAPRDVVVTLTPVAPEFGPGVAPSFTLTVVNTGKIDCTFDVGAQKLVTRIKSGSDRIWTSAHCDDTAGSSIQRLRRGVPHTGVLVWDRRRSDKGCDGPRTKALPGTYVIQAEGGGVRTDKGVFELAEGGRGRG